MLAPTRPREDRGARRGGRLGAAKQTLTLALKDGAPIPPIAYAPGVFPTSHPRAPAADEEPAAAAAGQGEEPPPPPPKPLVPGPGR